MTFTPSPHDEFGQLLGKLFDGKLSLEEQQRFSHILSEDEEVRQYYVRIAAVHAHLSARCTLHSLSLDLNAQGEITPDLSSAVPPEVPTPQVPALDSSSPPLLAETLRHLGSTLIRPLPFTFVIMLIALLPLLGFFVFRSAPEQGAPLVTSNQPAVVAKLIRQTPATQWSKTKTSLQPGTALRQGQSISLTSGVAEIEFASGAKVLLEGPAHFVLDGVNESNLVCGRLTAQVSPSARGFTVQTSDISVVDLGTEFGLSVNKDGTVEAHVFKGQVDMVSRGSPKNTRSTIANLTAGQAVRVLLSKTPKAPPRIVRMASTPQQFVRHIEAYAPPMSLVQFSHNGNTNPETEGWQAAIYENRIATKKKLKPSEAGPVEDDGTPAWMVLNNDIGREIQYKIDEHNGLTREIINQAKQKGWVMRVRVKANNMGPNMDSGCSFFYSVGTRNWGISPTLKPDGSQCALLRGMSSLGTDVVVPIPNSQDKFVTYEIHYRPATNDADVYINGQCVATRWVKIDNIFTARVQFGLNTRRPGKATFAEVNWWIPSEDTSSEQKRGN